MGPKMLLEIFSTLEQQNGNMYPPLSPRDRNLYVIIENSICIPVVSVLTEKTLGQLCVVTSIQNVSIVHLNFVDTTEIDWVTSRWLGLDKNYQDPSVDYLLRFYTLSEVHRGA